MSTWNPNCDGYLTVHPEPAAWSSTPAVLALTPQQTRRCWAIHEAGHAVLLIRAGLRVESMTLYDADQVLAHASGGAAAVTNMFPEPASYRTEEVMLALAAGARAADRWLHEQRLWTPARAWAVERTAREDRQYADQIAREDWGTPLTYGQHAHRADYAVITRETDAALARVWGRVLTLARALDRAGHLAAEAIAAIATGAEFVDNRKG
ncbi:hypothetical protein [Kitasatospora sp. NPDC004272]